MQDVQYPSENDLRWMDYIPQYERKRLLFSRFKNFEIEQNGDVQGARAFYRFISRALCLRSRLTLTADCWENATYLMSGHLENRVSAMLLMGGSLKARNFLNSQTDISSVCSDVLKDAIILSRYLKTFLIC